MNDKTSTNMESITNQNPPQQSFAEALKPVSGVKTTTSKVFAVLGMISGSITTAMGAYALVTRKSIANLHNLENDALNSFNSIIKVGGAALVGTGLLSIFVSKANFDSAGGAERARNFAELHDNLNQKNIGMISR